MPTKDKEELEKEVRQGECVGEHDFIVPIATQINATELLIVQVCKKCGEVREKIIKLPNNISIPTIHSNRRKM